MKNNGHQKTFDITYIFNRLGGETLSFTITLDADSLALITDERQEYPAWTQLASNQCPHCPLDIAHHLRCPVASNIVDLIEPFGNVVSYEEVDVTIHTTERTYQKRTPIQYGVSSLIGIYMVTSGCPYLDKLKPMVRFHLPFATLEETTYRAISMYLIAQYFRNKRGKEPDMSLSGLAKIYEDIRTVNEHFIKRLAKIQVEDANLNAIGILGTFANFVKFMIDEDLLQDVENQYLPYLLD